MYVTNKHIRLNKHRQVELYQSLRKYERRSIRREEEEGGGSTVELLRNLGGPDRSSHSLHMSIYMGSITTCRQRDTSEPEDGKQAQFDATPIRTQ